jgi:hypothetical protein
MVKISLSSYARWIDDMTCSYAKMDRGSDELYNIAELWISRNMFHACVSSLLLPKSCVFSLVVLLCVARY